MMEAELSEKHLNLMMTLRKAAGHSVLAAMEAVPRDVFVEPHFAHRSWEDIALPIQCGQTISQPTVVACMTESLDLQPRHTVLEIGTGSGYQAAILSKLCRRIYTIERHAQLVKISSERFKTLGLRNIISKLADGSLGWIEVAPFDRILLTAAAEDIPRPLIDQLALGGILLMPIGAEGSEQMLLKVTKTPQGLEYQEVSPVRFVPLVSGVSRIP